MSENQKLKIGISACLLGDKVRFDGGHKALHFANKTLSNYVDYQSVCPEVGIGMSIPRKPIRLIDHEDQIKLVATRDSSIDYTEVMHTFANQKMKSCNQLDGFIVTAKSPSCGMERLKVYDYEGNVQHRKGVGLFTQTLIATYPNLPVEEDGRLNDAPLRENFIERIFAFNNWRTQVAPSNEIKNLIKFHSNHKYQIMSHSYQGYKKLGQLVANQANLDFDEIKELYIADFMQIMKSVASRKRHSNVLQHVQGYFKKQLTTEDKAELTKLIVDYRTGLVPLLSPVTLIKHYLKKYPNDYLSQQTYFNPYPLSMGLNG
jgi:uncharacterized protein YbgA (DUF1722 family)/uncharacterized protein YbbK (DUF523 family)